ncbi:MAG: hypothetical protein PF569_08050 [Candidatus Woesearchaeota archaeon]|jgi:hypothetical protein|nr:hypothetical protein [Candidatus Woesearchaeota archaeon]
MAGITANHQKGKPIYWQTCTSVRIVSGYPSKKIFIKYEGKNPKRINLDSIRGLTVAKQTGETIFKRISQLKSKYNALEFDELYKDTEVKNVKTLKEREELLKTIHEHGTLNNQHLRWLQHVTGVSDPSLSDLDTIFEKKINSKDKLTNTILNLTSKDSSKYFENLQEVFRIERIIRDLEKKQVIKADMGGYGGAFDPTKEGTDEEFKRDEIYAQDSISGKLKEFNRELLRLNNANNKFETKHSKDLEHLKTFIENNDPNKIKLDMDFEFDHRHHINDVMEVYADAKRYKVLQLIKLKYKEVLKTDKLKLKYGIINEESDINNFSDIQNIYSRSFAFDYACDYIDKKIFKPLSLAHYEKGNTRKFLNQMTKGGFVTRQFVAKEKGDRHIHYTPNFIDIINEGKSNLLRRYTGISKASMNRILNHSNLELVKNIHESNISRREIGKKCFKIKGLYSTWRKTLHEKGIKNIKELGFMLSLHSHDDVRESCKIALNLFEMSDIYKTKDVLKQSAKTLIKQEKISKKTSELTDMEKQMREYYGENWKEILNM